MTKTLPKTEKLTLTQVTFDPTSPSLRHLLASRERMHAAIAAATDGSARPLWRLDADRLYILSDALDRDRLTVRMGGNVVIRTADYGKLLSHIEEGLKLRFAIDANPVAVRNNKRRPLTDIDEQREWLTKRLAAAGANVEHLSVGQTSVHIFSKPNRTTRVTLQETSISGCLTVKDKQTFADALVRGIGKGKAYGLGLLMVAVA